MVTNELQRNSTCKVTSTGYILNVIRQSLCLIINPIIIDNFSNLFRFTKVDRASDSIKNKKYSCSSLLYILVFTGAFSSVAWSIQVELVIFWLRCLLPQGTPNVEIRCFFCLHLNFIR